MKRPLIFFSGFVIVLIGFFAWSESYQIAERGPASGETGLPPVELGEVWTSREQAIAEDIAQKSIQISKDHAANSDGKDFYHRDAHPKHHGCVKALWTPDSNVALQHDLFFPRAAGQEVQAWVRFSNGSPGGVKASDAEADVRGMAIKFMNPSGMGSGHMDLVLMSAERFFVLDAEEYAVLMSKMSRFGASIGGVLYMLPRFRSSLPAFRSAQVSKPTSPLLTYTSAVPYRFGQNVVRFKAVPELNADQGFEKSQLKNPNYLSDVLAASLKDKAVRYRIQAVINPDLNQYPVENPMLVWKDATEQSLGVLTLIPQDGIQSVEQMNFCENIHFNPWDTAPEMRPLGQINRIRKIVYDQVSKFRHEQNGRAELQPVNFEPCSTPQTADLCL